MREKYEEGWQLFGDYIEKRTCKMTVPSRESWRMKSEICSSHVVLDSI